MIKLFKAYQLRYLNKILTAYVSLSLSCLLFLFCSYLLVVQSLQFIFLFCLISSMMNPLKWDDGKMSVTMKLEIKSGRRYQTREELKFWQIQMYSILRKKTVTFITFCYTVILLGKQTYADSCSRKWKFILWNYVSW